MRAFNNTPLYARRRRQGSGSGLSVSAPSAILFLDSDQPQRPTISVADPDDGGSGTYTFRVQCVQSGETPIFTREATSPQTTVSDGSDASGDVTYAGTLAQINADLATDDGSEGFSAFAEGEGTVTLTLTRDSDTAQATATIYMGAVAALSGATVDNNISSGTTLESVTNLSGATYSIINYSALTDTVTPTISSVSPTDAATDQAITTNIVITFDQNVRFKSGGTGQVVVSVDGGADIEAFTITNATTATGGATGTASISGAALTINPFADLANSTTITYEIEADCIEDYNGNGVSLAAGTYTFDTVAASGGFVPSDMFDGTTTDSSGSEKGFWIDFSDTSNLYEEFDADGISDTTPSVGDPIGTAFDLADPGRLDNHFHARADTTVRPTFVSGGGAQFTAANSTLLEFLPGSDYFSGTEYHVFIVAKIPATDASGGRMFSAFNDPTVSIDYGAYGTGTQVYNSATNTTSVFTNGVGTLSRTYTEDVWTLIEQRVNATTQGLLIDGGTEATQSTAGAFTFDKFGIGASPNTGPESPTNAIIGEVIFIDREIDDGNSELSDLRSYLNTKWSIS